MIRKQSIRTASVRTARKRRAIRQTLRPAAAPVRAATEEGPPAAPVTTEDLAPFDEDDLRALRSGWTFVE